MVLCFVQVLHLVLYFQSCQPILFTYSIFSVKHLVPIPSNWFTYFDYQYIHSSGGSQYFSDVFYSQICWVILPLYLFLGNWLIVCWNNSCIIYKCVWWSAQFIFKHLILLSLVIGAIFAEIFWSSVCWDLWFLHLKWLAYILVSYFLQLGTHKRNFNRNIPAIIITELTLY